MRDIAFRTDGRVHGFIRRLVSPGDLGERLKPFVFLDEVSGEVTPGTGFGFHPHSGIATLTYHLDADVRYEDTSGQNGTVEATGLEWMRAGRGTWHKGTMHPHGKTTVGFQLWVALGPDLEVGSAEGLYIAPRDVPQIDNVRLLLGEYGGARSLIPSPSPMMYADVTLAAGARWELRPPSDQRVAWAHVYRGRVRTGGELVERTLVVFTESGGELVFEAKTDARFLVGTAKKHEYPLVLGESSVHTSAAALARGRSGIRAVGEELARAGRM